MADHELVPAPIVFRNVVRTRPVPSCVLSRDDIIALTKLVEEKGREGASLHIGKLEQPVDVDRDEFDRACLLALSAPGMSALVTAANGEQLVVQSSEDLAPQTLPRRLQEMFFDTAAPHRTRNWEPENRVEVTLDFATPPGFDAYDPNSSPTPNKSRIDIRGASSTWVSGVEKALVDFFEERGTRRRWLHEHVWYNVYQWLVAIPGALWLVYRVDDLFELAERGMHGALAGAIYIYLFLVGFLVARGLVLGFRWTFPLIEFEGSVSGPTRSLVATILSSLLLALLYDVVKAIIF